MVTANGAINLLWPWKVSRTNPSIPVTIISMAHCSLPGTPAVARRGEKRSAVSYQQSARRTGKCARPTSGGGPFLPTASLRLDLADLFSLEWSNTVDRSAGPLLVVHNSFPSSRATARGPLLSNRERFERRFVERNRTPLLGLVRAKRRRLTFEKGPAFADSRSGDCRWGTHTKGPLIADRLSISGWGLLVFEQPHSELGKCEMLPFDLPLGRLASGGVEAVRFHGAIELQERRVIA